MKARGICAILSEGRNGIYNKDGTIYTGFYKDWGSLSKEDHSKVLAESLGITSTKPRKTSAAKSSQRQVTKLKKQLKEVKRKVALLSQATKQSPEGDEDDDDDNSLVAADDAGNQFGGRNSKRNKKDKR